MPYGVDAGARAIERLLALEEPPTAVFAYSDEIAISALRGLALRGVDVPAGLSVIGVDDHPQAELFGLTTMAQSVEDQGRLAGEMAISLLRGEVLEQPAVVVPSALITRRTTAPPP
jgi:DNA-binding LacI/PurR family transcriptional regulator